MELLIQKIEEKNSWGKNELGQILAETSTKYSNKVMNKPFDLTSLENTKENIIVDTCNHVLVKIQSQTSWGKNVVKEMIFKKLIEEVSC